MAVRIFLPVLNSVLEEVLKPYSKGILDDGVYTYTNRICVFEFISKWTQDVYYKCNLTVYQT